VSAEFCKPGFALQTPIWLASQIVGREARAGDEGDRQVRSSSQPPSPQPFPACGRGSQIQMRSVFSEISEHLPGPCGASTPFLQRQTNGRAPTCAWESLYPNHIRRGLTALQHCTCVKTGPCIARPVRPASQNHVNLDRLEGDNEERTKPVQRFNDTSPAVLAFRVPVIGMHAISGITAARQATRTERRIPAAVRRNPRPKPAASKLAIISTLPCIDGRDARYRQDQPNPCERMNAVI